MVLHCASGNGVRPEWGQGPGEGGRGQPRTYHQVKRGNYKNLVDPVGRGQEEKSNPRSPFGFGRLSIKFPVYIVYSKRE